jgi:hypothetical protein
MEEMVASCISCQFLGTFAASSGEILGVAVTKLRASHSVDVLDCGTL